MARSLQERINNFKEYVKQYENLINLENIDLQYKDAKTQIELECKLHGKFKVTPSNLVSRGDQCKMCKSLEAKVRMRDTESFIKKSKQIHGTVYDYSKSIYSKAHEQVLITCRTHGDFYQKANDHVNGSGCTLCGHNLRFDKLTKDLDERIAEFNKTHNNFYDYSFIENYKNIYSIIKIKCPEHGFFTQVAHNHWKGAQCPSCSNMFSKGSTKIQKVLSELNIEFFMEYTFNDLLHPLTKNKLRFDFYLPQQNIAIEFNGQQHYKESTWFSERNLEEQQLSDEKIRRAHV